MAETPEFDETWMPIRTGKNWTYRGLADPRNAGSAMMIYGEPREGMPVRVHDECLCGDVLGTTECDCEPQLNGAIAAIEAAGSGALIYLRGHEGRGHGTFGKIRAIKAMRESGEGLIEDRRTYEDARDFVSTLDINHIRLLTNNPAKVAALSELDGLKVTRVPHLFPIHLDALAYLRAQMAAGYLFTPEMVWIRRDSDGTVIPLIERNYPVWEEGPVADEFGVWRTRLLLEPTVTTDPRAFIYGEPRDGMPVLIKSSCMQCEGMLATDCGCIARKTAAKEFIWREGAGAIIYLNQEGLGQGLLNKIRALRAEERGKSTVEFLAEVVGDGKVDIRRHDDVTTLLRTMGLRSITLLDDPIGKFGTALHPFEVRTVPLDYEVPMNAALFRGELSRRGFALPPTRKRDELPTVASDAIRELHALRESYQGRIEKAFTAHQRRLDGLFVAAATGLDVAADRFAAQAVGLLDAAATLRETHPALPYQLSAADDVALRRRIARFLADGNRSRLLNGSGTSTSHAVEARLAATVAQQINWIRAAVSTDTQSLAVARAEGKPDERRKQTTFEAELQAALSPLVTEETVALMRRRGGPIDPDVVRRVHMRGSRVVGRVELNGEYEERDALLRIIPTTTAVARAAMRDGRHSVGQAFLAATGHRLPSHAARSVLPLQMAPWEPCYARAVNPLDAAVDPLARQPMASMIFNYAGRLRLLEVPGWDPEPPALADYFDRNQLEGQLVYRQLRAGESEQDPAQLNKWAPRPIDHTFHRLGQKWKFWAQRSVVGDEPLCVFVFGQPTDDVLVRVQSECLNGEVCQSDHCECGQQIDGAFEAVVEEGAGVVIYLKQEGRGAGTMAKARAYKDKEGEGIETDESFRRQRLEVDPRVYEDVVLVLQQLGLATKRIRLLTNNVDGKLNFLLERGFDVTRVPQQMPATKTSKSYIATKAAMGHMFEKLDWVLDPVSARQSRRTAAAAVGSGTDWWRAQRRTRVPASITAS